MEKYIHRDYKKIVSSILSLAFSNLGSVDRDMSEWWHYVVTIIVIIVIYSIFYFLLFLASLLYKKFSKPKIGFNNGLVFNGMLRNLEELYGLECKYDNCTSIDYKSILSLAMKKLIKSITLEKNLLFEGNTGLVKVKGSSDRVLETLKVTESYLKSVSKKLEQSQD